MTLASAADIFFLSAGPMPRASSWAINASIWPLAKASLSVNGGFGIFGLWNKSSAFARRLVGDRRAAGVTTPNGHAEHYGFNMRSFRT